MRPTTRWAYAARIQLKQQHIPTRGAWPMLQLAENEGDAADVRESRSMTALFSMEPEDPAPRTLGLPGEKPSPGRIVLTPWGSFPRLSGPASTSKQGHS